MPLIKALSTGFKLDTLSRVTCEVTIYTFLAIPGNTTWHNLPVKLEPPWRILVFTNCSTGLQSLVPSSSLVVSNLLLNIISLFTNVYRLMKQHKCTLTSYICFLILPCTVLGTLIEFATKKSLFNFNANMSKLMVLVFLDDLDIRKETGPCSLGYKTAIWPKMDKFRTKFNRTKNISKRTLKLPQQFPAINVNTRSVQGEM